MRRPTLFLFVTTLFATLAVVVFVLARSTQDAEWPAPVAVIGTASDERTPVKFLGIADPVHHVVVAVSPDAIVEIPGKGFLRAYNAWRLGGSGTVRETLGLLFGIDVPFAAVGEGATYEEVLGSSLAVDATRSAEPALRGALRDASEEWRRLEVGTAGPELDPASLRAATLALGGRPASKIERGTPRRPVRSPTASPDGGRIDPRTVTVDVLNGGEVRGAAARTAEKLEAKAYRIGKVGDLRPKRADSVAYFASGKEVAGRQVGADLGYGAEAAPPEVTIRSGVDVLVVVGEDVRS